MTRPRAGFSTPSRSWMGTSIYVLDPFASQMCVQLCGADARMSEQLLNDAQVRSSLQQVGRERMPERVRADPVPKTGAPGRRAKYLPPSPAIQPLAAHGEKDRPSAVRVPAPCRKPAGPDVGDVAPQPGHRHLPDRHLALAIALAYHAHQTRVQRDVLQVQTDRLRYAQPRGVEKLEERSIADTNLRVVALHAQQSVNLVDAQHLREQAWLARQIEARRQVRLDEPLSEAEPVEAAQRSRPAPQSGRSKNMTSAVAGRSQHAQVANGSLGCGVPRGRRPAARGEVQQIRAVGGKRRRR